MINAVDIVVIETACDLGVKSLCGGQVMRERFFYNEARQLPAAGLYA